MLLISIFLATSSQDLLQRSRANPELTQEVLPIVAELGLRQQHLPDSPGPPRSALRVGRIAATTILVWAICPAALVQRLGLI